MRNYLTVFSACAVLFQVSVSSGVEVDIVTGAGTVTVAMASEEAPTAVAHFISLADGRPRLDAESGAVRSGPFFDGRKFDRVENSGTAKLAYFGSPVGYSIKDEFSAEWTHARYVLAMESAGPNTNGGNFYLTGNMAMPDRDGIHVVIGEVISGESVVDAVVAAGAGGASILSVAVRREGFDESSIDLPIVTSLAPDLMLTSAPAVVVDHPSVSNSVFTVYSSSDLSNWQKSYRRQTGLGGVMPGSLRTIDQAPGADGFYHMSEVLYPDQIGPENFANRVLRTDQPGAGKLVFVFDPGGMGGTYENLVPGLGGGPDMVFFSGSFEVRGEVPASFEAYGFDVLLYLFDAELGGSPFVRMRGGYDHVASPESTGRVRTEFMSSPETNVFDDEGTFILEEPGAMP